AQYYGVLDHNLMTTPSSAALLEVIGKVDPTPPPSPQGTPNNLFVEDNTIIIERITNTGQGCMDAWGASAAIVWRHNTSTNCTVTSHGVVHQGGPQNIELYANHLSEGAGSAGTGLEDGYRLFHHQGSGEILAFDNFFTAWSGRTDDPLEVTHYR